MVFIIDPNTVLGPKPCPFYVPVCTTKCPLDFYEPLYGIPV